MVKKKGQDYMQGWGMRAKMEVQMMQGPYILTKKVAPSHKIINEIKIPKRKRDIHLLHVHGKARTGGATEK
jgi:hypothetical protein